MQQQGLGKARLTRRRTTMLRHKTIVQTCRSPHLLQLLAVFVTSQRAERQLRMQSLGHNRLPQRLSRSRQFAQFVWRLTVVNSTANSACGHCLFVLHMFSATNCDCYRVCTLPCLQNWHFWQLASLLLGVTLTVFAILSDSWRGFQGHDSFKGRISRKRCIL